MKVLILTNLFPTPWDPLRGAFNRQQFERWDNCTTWTSSPPSTFGNDSATARAK